MESWEMFIDFGLIAGMSLIGIVLFFLISAKVDFSRKLLIVFFLSAFFFLLYYYGYLHRSRVIGGIAVLLGNGNGFLLGPTILILLKSYFISKQNLLSDYLKRLIPYFVVVLIINIPFFLSMVFGLGRPYHKFMVRYDYITITVGNLYFLYYLILTRKVYLRLRNIYEQHYSSQEVNNLKWMSLAINGFIVIILADNLLTIYELIFSPFVWNIGTIMAFWMIGLYAFLCYKGMFQARILIPEYLIEKYSGIQQFENKISGSVTEPRSENEYKKPYSKQLGIYSESEIEELKSKLIDLLEVDKLYINENLNLTELSEHLGVSSKKLSELLNQHLNTNFYNLINEYRVNEVKRRIMDGEAEKYNLLSIAFDSGFQSKASFNRIFKQKAGVSPSEFVKQVSASELTKKV